MPPESTPTLILQCLTAFFTAVAAVFGVLNHQKAQDSNAKLTANTAKIDAVQEAVAPQTVITPSKGISNG